MKSLQTVFILIVILTTVASVQGGIQTKEHRLLAELLDGYDKDVRPVLDNKKPVVLYITLVLKQIYNFDFRNQLISLKLWLQMTWKDEFMTWNPGSYNDTDVLYINPNRLWSSDVTIYNEAGSERAEVISNVIEVSSNGDIRMGGSVKPTVSCQLDVTYFPWDVQQCYIQFGSLMQDKGILDIYNASNKLHLGNYIEHGEWEITETSARRKETKFRCCPNPIPSLYFDMTLRRRSTYYLANLILPCLFITLTGLLALCLPPDSGEKISLSVTVLLATTVFLLVVGESMPVQSLTVPYISLFFLCSMVLLTLSLFSTISVICVHHKGNQGVKPPRWLVRVLLKGIGPMLMIRVPDNEVHLTNEDMSSENQAMLIRKIDQCDSKKIENEVKKRDGLQENLETVAKGINTLLKHIKQKEEQENICSEWEACARVLDRFFFVIYLILLIILSSVFLSQRP